jgi:PAS domain S-box-containing protein
MPSLLKRRTPRSASCSVVAAAGIYALVGGLASFAGWPLDVPRLTEWDGHGVSIQPNTALVTAAAGLALLTTSVGMRWPAAVIGAAVGLTAAATLLENLADVDLGIDTAFLFGRPWGRRGTLAPGRMGVPASFCWTLAGLALVLSTRGDAARRWVPALGIVVTSVAVLSLVGYAFGADTLFAVPRWTTIAMQTATFLLAVGIGLVAAVPERDPTRTLLADSGAGEVARRALPLVITLPLVFGYLRLRGQDAGLFDTAMGTALLALSMSLLTAAVVWWGIRALARRERALSAAAALRDQAEARLREGQEFISRITHVAPTMLYVYDLAAARNVWVNRTVVTALGYSEAEVHQMGPDLLPRLLHPDDAARYRDHFERLRRLADDETAEFEYRMRHRDGTWRWLLSHEMAYAHAADGLVTQIVGAAQDITDRKHAEQALRDSDRRKDEFLATLAHELRNPLAPIRNGLHILRLAGNDAPANGPVVEMMERQVNHMVRLVDDLLEVSRISRGKIELRRETVELAAAVRMAVDAVGPTVAAAGHRLEISLPAEPIRLDADPVRLAQVLTNLLNNAAKYTDPGGQIWITACRDGPTAVIAVRDTGIGIPAEMLPRIFDLFMQVDHGKDFARGGLGIGLALVKSLVELHGGTVKVASAGAGRGSEFTVRLPAVTAPASTDEVVDRPAGPAGLAERRILIVDDNRDAADSLAAMLRLLGAHVRVVYDGLSALDAASADRPTDVLLDIDMPGMDGYEVAVRLRQDTNLHGIQLVAVTGWGQDDDRRRSAEAGFDHHLVKPVGPAALQRVLAAP